MPTVGWNRRWTADLQRVLTRGKFAYYGQQWGDPAGFGPRRWLSRILLGRKFPRKLATVRKLYIEPHVQPDTVCLEIGPGGGRWTQYLLDAREVIVVDVNPEFFAYLLGRFRNAASKLRFYQTTGYELDGLPSDSVTYVFSFGTFVHIDPEGIDAYLGAIRRVMAPGALAVLQYADKTKPAARDDPGFSDMNEGQMEAFVTRHGFRVLQHDRSLLEHSNIVVLRKQPAIER